LLGGAIDPKRLDRIAETFADEMMATNILRPALDQIVADRRSGYRVMLATASFRFYVEAIARRLDVSDVIATDLQHSTTQVIPLISGENCYDLGKLRMVKAWLEGQGIERGDCHVRFYSDHVSDSPCLEWADEAFVANAHTPLRLLAAQRGWTACDWLSES
jgi:HAD superfamily phosphoserine phosphatase-like hydrolase